MASLSTRHLFDVAGKVVLVTGGGRGIGKMIAEGFVANGSTVYISSRDKAALNSTAEELTANAEAATTGGPIGRCVAIEGNLSSRAGCEALAAAIEEAEPGGLHVLVNNSGASWGESLGRTSGKLNWGCVLPISRKQIEYYYVRSLTRDTRRTGGTRFST